MEERFKRMNDIQREEGEYVAYWMQGSQRTRYNHSLEYGVMEANRMGVPLVVFFNLMDDYPEANYRHYYFMVEGLIEIRKKLKGRGIEFFILYGDMVKNISEISRDASLLICDKGYMKIDKMWRGEIADRINCPMIEVESNLVVPVEAASSKEEYGARTIRPKIKRVLDDFLYDFQQEKYRVDKKITKKVMNSWKDILLPEEGPEELCERLKLDRSVERSRVFKGGEIEAQRRLEEFLEEGLKTYSSLGSNPGRESVSKLSPYLHFGQISPLEIASRVLKERNPENASDVEDFLEELIIRRELAFNFIYYNENYDKWEGITYPWAYDTLRIHTSDEREYLYTLKELEEGATHDLYWNTAQREMVGTGYMHGYMRMYWCKKILEWSPTPKEAYERAIYLNNKYFIDGRDPNSYTGVAWCFGKHDRAWKERAVYGKVRCMMASGLERKFHMEEYIDRVEKILGEGR